MRSSTGYKRLSPKVQPLTWDDSAVLFYFGLDGAGRGSVGRDDVVFFCSAGDGAGVGRARSASFCGSRSL